MPRVRVRPLSAVVYVGVDNKGGHLTQERWAEMASRIRFHIIGFLNVSKVLNPGGDGSELRAEVFHLPTAKHQHAIWGITLPDSVNQEQFAELQHAISTCADRYGRPTTWAYVPDRPIHPFQEVGTTHA